MDFEPISTETRRDALIALLKTVLGSNYVYYQPPESIKMEYDAIKLSLDDVDVQFADNGKYRERHRWQVIAISRLPDPAFIDKLRALPLCSFDRWYPANNLNHYVFTLYF